MHATQVGPIPMLWTLHPWQVTLFVFAFDFLAINIVNLLSGQWTRSGFWRYKSFAIGDSLLVPAYAGFAAKVLQSLPVRHYWPTNVWVQAVLLVVAVVYAFVFEAQAVRKRPIQTAGDFYHLCLTAIMFYLISSSALVIIFGGFGPMLPAIGAGLALAGHIYLGVVVDGVGARPLVKQQ